MPMASAASPTVVRSVGSVASPVRLAGQPGSCRGVATTGAGGPPGRRAVTRAATRTGVAAARVATAWPPDQAYRAAPASGATSLVPSWALDRQPLTTARTPGGRTDGRSAVSPAP